MRQPHQILAFPFKKTTSKEFQYAIFCRKGNKERWQGIAGGVEEGETYLEACKREASEEANIKDSAIFYGLDSISTMPVVNVAKSFLWGDDVFVIYEHCFGIDVTNQEIILSHEHTRYEWLSYEEAIKRLTWDSNKNALWELNYKLVNKKIGN